MENETLTTAQALDMLRETPLPCNMQWHGQWLGENMMSIERKNFATAAEVIEWMDGHATQENAPLLLQFVMSAGAHIAFRFHAGQRQFRVSQACLSPTTS